MAHLFRPTAVKPIPANAVVRTVKGKRVATWTNRRHRAVIAQLTDCGKKCRVTSPTWWIEYTNAGGARERCPGYKDRAATLQLAAEIEREAEDIRAGRASPRQQAPLQLLQHVAGFQVALENKGNSQQHVEYVINNVRAVLKGLNLTTPATVDCDRVAHWLANECRTAECQRSTETCNRHVKHLRQFGRWLVRTKRAKANPFELLVMTATNGEKSRVRRRLTDDELQRLIRAARKSHEAIHGLAGPDRARLYLLAAYTGLRMGSLAMLTQTSFTWSRLADLPTAVTAAASTTKNKKPHTVPLHPDVAAELADWLRDLPTGSPLFPGGRWSERGAELVTHDLDAARAAWIKEGKGKRENEQREKSDTLKVINTAGEVFDFHALRVQFISGLALAGVPLTAAQKLAGHSTPNLTANIYTRFGPPEMAEQVAKLPGFTTRKPRGRVRTGH